MRLLLLLMMLATTASAQCIDVSEHKTGGDGSVSSPYTGWTAISWTKASYCFPDGDGAHGYYAFSSSPSWTVAGIKLSGEAGTVLKFTGSGKAVQFVGAVQQGTGAVGPSFITFQNFTIQGGANATHGLYVEDVHRSYFDNIQVKDVTQAAFEVRFSTSSTYRRLRHHYFNEYRPANGLVTDDRELGERVQESTFERLVIEDTTDDGIVLNHTWQSQFDGTVQGIGGDGFVVNSNCENNRLHHLNFEAVSGTSDILDNGLNTTIDGVFSHKLLTIGASARFPKIKGGMFCSVTFTAGAKMPTVDGSPLFNLTNCNGSITTTAGINGVTEFFNYQTNTPSSAFFVFPTLINNWSDAPYIAYRRSGNTVYIEGAASGGTVGATVFTLDVQYRPVREHRFVVACGSSTAPADCAILVATTGEVKVLNVNAAAAQSALYFDGINFKAYPYQ